MSAPRRRIPWLLAALAVLTALLAVSRYAILTAPRRKDCLAKAAEHAEMVTIIRGYIRGGAIVVPAYDDGPPADARRITRIPQAATGPVSRGGLVSLGCLTRGVAGADSQVALTGYHTWEFAAAAVEVAMVGLIHRLEREQRLHRGDDQDRIAGLEARCRGSGLTFTPVSPWCMTILILLSAWISPTLTPTSLPVGQIVISVKWTYWPAS